MSSLITSDLHLNSRVTDRSRWNILEWLVTTAAKLSIDQTIILGDLTDAKDKHEAELVNEIAKQLGRIAPVYVLMGNHDYVDPAYPFFDFASLVKGVTFIKKPVAMQLRIAGKDARVLFLPSTRDYLMDWDKLSKWNIYDYIFCHQTFTGAEAETGTKLQGVPLAVFDGFEGQVWSGDIHVPQRLGCVEYCGAPYHIRFGDEYKARVVHIDAKGKTNNLKPVGIRDKVLIVVGTMDDLKRAKVPENAQVKIRVRLPRREYPNWPLLREQIHGHAKELGWEMNGCELLALEDGPKSDGAAPDKTTRRDPSSIAAAYAETHKFAAHTRAVGSAIMKKVLEQ